MTSAVRGLAEIVLMVRDVPESLRFYQDVLGLEVISPSEMKGPRFLRAGPAGSGVPAQIVLVPRPATAQDLPGDRRLRRARCSARIRTVSTAAFSAENTSA